MKKGLFFILLSFFSFAILSAQSIEEKWILKNIEGTPETIFEVSEGDYLSLKEGVFSFDFNDHSQQLTGDYFSKDNILLLFPDKAEDSIIKYRIKAFSDSTLVLSRKGVSYSLITKKEVVEIST